MKKILLLLFFISIVLCSGSFAGTSKSPLSGEILENQILNRRAQLSCVLQRMFKIAPKINIENRIPFVLQNMFEGELTSGENTRFSISDIRTEKDFFLIEMLREIWSGGNWVNDWKEIYSYDANGNRIECLDQYWAGGNWVNDWKDTYSYDANGNMIEWLGQYWAGGNWINSYRYTYTYELTDVDDNQISQIEDNLLCYPNPFNSQTTISFNLPIRALVNLTIYNIKGQKLKTLVNNSILDRDDTHNYIWNGKNESGESVKNGVYFYKLQCENKTIVKRILLMK